MTIELRFQPYRLFPYERDLALRELTSLGLTVLKEGTSSVVATGDVKRDALRRLTYFREVSWGDVRLEPEVARIERRHLERRNMRVGARQATRYLVHGLHEYKGKFHPHVVRAFANLIDVRDGDLIIDPFGGSGTTLVEAMMLGCHGAGADLSPLAVLITEAKVAALAAADRPGLASRLEAWGAEAARAAEDAYDGVGSVHEAPLDDASARYLQSWFTPSGYRALIAALVSLAQVASDRPLHLLASVALSSILREAGLQAPEDLRVRRRRAGATPTPLPALLRLSVDAAVDAVRESAELPLVTTSARCRLADVTDVGVLERLRGDHPRAAVITSPPYATALPYIDTDRLSIVALGLTVPPALRRLEASLIGSREWTGSEEGKWNALLADNAAGLPKDITAVCRLVQERNGSAAGFRRRAVPALLYRYFSQMDAAFLELRKAVRPGERAVFIVGVNRTGRGGEQVVIRTPELLGAIASQRGFEVDEVLPLETWPRYGLHHENGVAGEAAVVMTASTANPAAAAAP